MTQSCFSLLKAARLNSTHYLIMKINNKNELKVIVINHSADIGYKEFVKITKSIQKNLLVF